MHIAVLLELIVVVGLILLFTLAALGRSAARDHYLKQRATSTLAGLVRHLLGVYTRGP